MKEIDEFLQFLLEHESDERISFSKKMKYGYRYYYISFNIDEKPEEDNNKNQSYGSLRGYRITDSIEIVVDNRNTCIELIYDNSIENIIIEDKKLVDKYIDYPKFIEFMKYRTKHPHVGKILLELFTNNSSEETENNNDIIDFINVVEI